MVRSNSFRLADVRFDVRQPEMNGRVSALGLSALEEWYKSEGVFGECFSLFPLPSFSPPPILLLTMTSDIAECIL